MMTPGWYKEFLSSEIGRGTASVNSTELPVTVIIPAYNAERFIPRVLRMLEFQTCAPAEVIVIDDGSTDATAEVAERSGVRVIRAKHGGLAATRNVGMAAASHDWVAFLDADDLWHPRKLELQWALITQRPDVSLVFTDFDEVDSAGAPLLQSSVASLNQYKAIAKKVEPLEASTLDRDLLSRYLPEWDFFLPSSTLIHRRLVEAVGDFNTTVKAEDFEFYLRCMTRTTVGMVDRPMVGYVQHSGQITANWSRDFAILELCLLVLRKPSLYPHRSSRAFRSRLPNLLARCARIAIAQRHYRKGAALCVRAISSCSLPSIGKTVLRAMKSNKMALPLSKIFLNGFLIVGRDSHRTQMSDPFDWGALMRSISP